VRVRRGDAGDVPFLGVMMREAGFPPARRPPLDEALRAPHVAQWIEGWGRDGDLAVVAVDDDGAPVGAAWCRGMTSWTYGFVDAATPVVAIAVDEARRGRGIGTALLAALASAARNAGARALSLSVSRENPALRLYERVGFVRVVDDPDRQLVMRLPL
jgi:ribosomal protein S18 acetylase RimI-like enzyme